MNAATAKARERKHEKDEDNVIDAFDYIVNLKQTHNMLGEAILLFERAEKRHGYTREQSLVAYEHSSHPPHLGSRSAWFRKIADTLRVAKKDYLKQFKVEAEECGEPDWVKAVFSARIAPLLSRTYGTMNPGHVVIFAMQNQRDRFPEK